MSSQIEVYGRVGTNVEYQYGPRQFSPDWGGVFTALDIVKLLTAIPKVPTSKRSNIKAEASGKVAEQANRQMWLERLEAVLLELKLRYLMVNATITHWHKPDEMLHSQSVVFSGDSKTPALAVAEVLARMNLNKWGILKEITAALSDADEKLTSVSVFMRL